MAILSIRIIGDPVLRTVADPVTEFGPELAKLVADMTETMEDVEGAGLAAPQVGVSQRVFTYRVGGVEGHIINPVLENSEDFQPDEVEGCLSIPGLGFPRPPVSAGPGSPGWTCTATRSRSRARACWPAASSTRPTTWTASSTPTGWKARTARAALRCHPQCQLRRHHGADDGEARQDGRLQFRRRQLRHRFRQPRSVRVLFAGTPAVAVPSLDALVDAGFDVVAVLTRPDAPLGRKRVLTPSPVAARAAELGIEVIRASQGRRRGHGADRRAPSRTSRPSSPTAA